MRMGLFVLILFGVGCARGAELSPEQLVQLAQQSVQIKLIQKIFKFEDPHKALEILQYGHELATQKQGPVRCQICDKMISSKGNLVQHLSTHLPSQRFPCPYGDCSATFARQRSISEHNKRVHQGVQYEKKFACDLCGECFGKNCNMTRHKGSSRCCELQRTRRRQLSAPLPAASSGLELLATTALAQAAELEE